jgi:hypothetical protein
MDAVGAGEQPIALLGHSMATDILVRAAATRSDVGPMVLISAFSQAIDGTEPENLLLVAGQWEPGLRAFAVEAAQMVDADAAAGQTLQSGSVIRRAVVAPFSEHVSVLHSRVARAEALAWIDRGFGRTSQIRVLPTGWAILSLFAGLVMVFGPLAAMLPRAPRPAPDLSWWQLLGLIIGPGVIAPVVALMVKPSFLPVLVADHLMLHLLIFGAVQLALMRYWRLPIGPVSGAAFALVLAWCVVFGLLLDRYAANFWPTVDRLWIIAVILVGAVPYMLADAALAVRAPFWQRLLLRLGFLGSLVLAVMLDFERLFFLIMIAPVMVLFYLIFGTVGRSAAQVSGPAAPGLALGIVLAWALGVSFPLFQP